MTVITAFAFGGAAALLLAWGFEVRTAARVSAHARAQLGLRPDLSQEQRQRPTLSRSSQRMLSIGIVISLVAIFVIGPVGLVLGIAPQLVSRSMNKRSARKRQSAIDDALAPALQRIVDQL
ncbi:MAG: hypothetical protein ACO3VQ_12645, partial [Ilumatobacteraceae bacterium]